MALVGYARVSKNDGSQKLDLQSDALKAAGVEEKSIFSDFASGKKDDRPGLKSCLQYMRDGDVLVIWKLDRLGRSLQNLVEIVNDLRARNIELKILAGEGAAIDTRTANGRFVLSIFASLAEFERELIRERTMEGLKAARARGKLGGRRKSLNPKQEELLKEMHKNPNISISQICETFKISKAGLYLYLKRGKKDEASGGIE